MVMLVDTHAHLTFEQYDDDRTAVIERAWQGNLAAMVLIGAGRGIDGNQLALHLAGSDRRFFATVGIHPHDTAGLQKGWEIQLKEYAFHPKVVAIGEIGLDFHYPEPACDTQLECFQRQLDLSKELELPVALHCRDANEVLWEVMEEAGFPPRRGVFHCFSGDVAFAKKVAGAGFFISISGVVTFKKSSMLRDVVSAIPLEHIVIETDCPYLAPEPYRGKRNEPAYVERVAATIAEIKKMSVSDVAHVTCLNAQKLFRLPKTLFGSSTDA